MQGFFKPTEESRPLLASGYSASGNKFAYLGSVEGKEKKLKELQLELKTILNLFRFSILMVGLAMCTILILLVLNQKDSKIGLNIACWGLASTMLLSLGFAGYNIYKGFGVNFQVERLARTLDQGEGIEMPA